MKRGSLFPLPSLALVLVCLAGLSVFDPSAEGEEGAYAETTGGRDSKLITIASNRYGRPEQFQLGGDGRLWHRWQDESRRYSAWRLLGNHTKGFTVGKNQDGRLEVFATDSRDGKVSHAWNDDSGSGWSDWANMGEMTATQLTVARNRSGTLEVFALKPDGSAAHVWQKAPSSGPWIPVEEGGGNWASLGGTGLSGPLRITTGMRMRLHARRGGQEVIAQRNPDGSWDPFSTPSQVAAREEQRRRRKEAMLDTHLSGSERDQARWLKDKQEEAGGYTPPPPPGVVECDRLKRAVEDSRIPSYTLGPGPSWAPYTSTAVGNIHWCNLSEVLDGFARACSWLDGFHLVRCNDVRRGAGCPAIRWGHRAETCGPTETALHAAPPRAGEHSVPGTMPRMLTSSGFARQLRERPENNPFDGGRNYEARPGAAPPPQPRIPEIPEIEIAD